MKKRIFAMCLATVMTLSLLVGCGSDSSDKQGESTTKSTNSSSEEKMKITLAGISGGMQTFPAYIAEKNGWFDEENLDVEIIYFENGPVQMESLISGAWDIAATGIGGVLTGVIAYDAQLLAAPHSDDGTQMIFARPDSAIVQAGTGHNSVNPDIYGDAESWKDAKVLCSAGTVLQYLLVKTLDGVGLTLDDIQFTAMDTPTSNSAFLSGQGDATVLTGVPSFDEDKKDFVVVSSGNMANTGLDCSVIATEDAVNDKHDEIIAFLKGYFRAIDWMSANREDAVDDLIAFGDESGKSMTREVAEVFIQAETYYSIEDNYKMLTEKEDGKENVILEQRILDILDFFIDAGNYSEGDDERFKGHTNSSFIEEIYNESK